MIDLPHRQTHTHKHTSSELSPSIGVIEVCGFMNGVGLSNSVHNTAARYKRVMIVMFVGTLFRQTQTKKKTYHQTEY